MSHSAAWGGLFLVSPCRFVLSPGHNMHLVYIDDSKDDRLACFSALSIPEDNWQDALRHLVSLRIALRDGEGVRLAYEIHSTEWLGGRGNPSKTPISKWRRASLFSYLVAGVALMPGISIFNAAVPRAAQDRAFEYLLNRINVNMTKSGSRAIIISDEGKDYDYLLRRMRHFNYIPSRFNNWPGHGSAKNIPINRIVEDISYRDSAKSYFVQAADWCAFSLLRNQNPTPAAVRYGFNSSFNILERVLVKAANGSDPLGIIR